MARAPVMGRGRSGRPLHGADQDGDVDDFEVVVELGFGEGLDAIMTGP